MVFGSNTSAAVGLLCALGIMLLGLFSTYPAVKAFCRGRSFYQWYVFSLFLFPAAFAASFFIKDTKRPS